MSMKCPSLGTSKTYILSSSRLPCCSAIFLYPCSVLSNVLQSGCFEKVSLAICNLFAYSTSEDTLKAWCLTADLVGSSFSLIYRTYSCRAGRTALMGAGGAALPGLPGRREVWEAAVAKGYRCFCCAGKGRC